MTEEAIGNQGPPSEDAAKLIDLRKVFAMLRRRKLALAITVLIVLALAAVTYLLVPARYSATASVALDRRVEEIVKGSEAAGQLPTDSPTVDTAVEVLTSSALAGRVVDRLQLDTVEGFGRAPGGPVLPKPQARSRAMSKVMSGLLVKRSGLSYAIDVNVMSPDKARVAEIANAVVDQYIDDERGTKVGDRERDSVLLRTRLATLRNDVIRAEEAVAQYRARTNLIDVQKDGTAVQQEISVLNTQLASARAEEAAAAARLGAVRSGSAGDGASPIVRELRAKQAALAIQRADLAGRYGPLHPDLATIDRQIADLNRSISTETSRSVADLVGDTRVANGRASAIQGALSRAQGSLVAGNAASVQLNELERNAESARGLYQAFLDRYRQNVAGEGTDRSKAYVIAHALPPSRPVFPDPMVFTLGGIVAALFAAVGVVLLLELLEAGIQNRVDFEQNLNMPVVGTVPDLRTIPGVKLTRGDDMAPADFLIDNQGSMFSESFRTVRAALKVGHPDPRIKVVAIASALPGEGKTTVSVCLARSAALAGANVLLVDCDVRRRTFSRSFDRSGQPDVGLTDLLAGKVNLESVLLRDEASGAWILPQSTQRAINYELVTSEVMRSLIADLRKRFDLVILDCAPVLPLAEARAIAGMADGVLFVARWRKTPANAARLAVDLLHRADANVLGGVLSLVNVKQQVQSGFGDELTYYKRYKKYYVEPVGA